MQFIFSLMLFAILLPLSAQNHVENANFSAFDFRAGQPRYWTNRPKFSGLKVPLTDQSGHFALQLASPVANKSVFWIGTLSGIKFGQTYRLTVRVKAPLKHWFRIYVERNKPVFKAFNGSRWQRGTSKWQLISFEFKYETPGAQPYVVFCVKGVKNCFATDFKVVKTKLD
jgi:hypothetical protein